MTNNKNSNWEKEATIKLKKWQVSLILGAMRLGIWAEDWCAMLVQTGIGTYDTHSGKWILAVGDIIRQIKKQTGVNDEDKEYGSSKTTLEMIQKWVDKQCQVYIEKRKKWEEEQYKKYKADKRLQEKSKKLINKLKPHTVTITKSMMKKMRERVRKIENEKR